MGVFIFIINKCHYIGLTMSQGSIFAKTIHPLYRFFWIWIFCISLFSCQFFDCEHTCGRFEYKDSFTHHFLGYKYNWKMQSYWDTAQKSWKHRLNILDKKHSIHDEENGNVFTYTSTIPKGQISMNSYAFDSIMQLMWQADKRLGDFPRKNKQLVMRYFFNTMDVSCMDAAEFERLLRRIVERREALKARNLAAWKPRINELDQLHSELKNLFQGCKLHDYKDELEHEQEPSSYLYFDKRNYTFVRLDFREGVVSQKLFRPTNYILISANEERKESCNCCKLF